MSIQVTVSCLLICVCSLGTYAVEKCSTLDGAWYNTLGSEMILSHSSDGLITGQYRTAVERSEGAAGSTHSLIIGAAPYNSPGAAVGLAVLWNNGSSATSWTGQCQVCSDGEEVLITSWLLRVSVDSCVDKWKSTLIGRDHFTRVEPGTGPRPDSVQGAPQRHLLSYSQREKRDAGSNAVRRCTLDGYWYNNLGSEMILQYHAGGRISGEYRTGVERESGSAGHTHSKVYGIGNPHDTSATFVLFVVWNNGGSVTGWVGQCHVCDGGSMEVIESAWLLRSQVPSCDDIWRSTLYGETSFTRHEQEDGPRREDGIHTPVGSAGEDDGTLHRGIYCINSAPHTTPLTLLLVLAGCHYIHKYLDLV